MQTKESLENYYEYMQVTNFRTILERYIFIPRLLLALAIITAVIYRVVDILKSGGSLGNFFSYFTIQSNLIGAATLVLLFYYRIKKSERLDNLDLLRFGSTLFLTITGVIYYLLLRDVSEVTDVWVNWIFHYIVPVYLLMDWLIIRPKNSITLKKSLLWLLFPIVYFIYSLIRGVIINWYPYPFIDVNDLGYARVMINAGFITLFAVASIIVLNLISRISIKKNENTI